jgi:manganese oxidase
MLIHYPQVARSIRTFTRYLVQAALCLQMGASLASAATLDSFAPPPPGDPSALTGPLVGSPFIDVNLAALPEANAGSFQGGPTGTKADTQLNGSIPLAAQQNNGNIDVPTNSKPSPLFGAQPFSQKLLLFEEFGPEKVDPNTVAGTNPLPPISAGGAALEAFLAQPGLSPYMSQFSNTTDQNPWKSAIETFMGRPLAQAPAEGRPPGEGFSHQRWNEFYPQSFFKTAMAGARTNGGFRDSKQRHGYQLGEFGPGGLYHEVYTSTVPGAPTLNGTTKGIDVRFHPNMPVQDPQALWTFDGTVPPKLLQARYGSTILMRHYNDLPIDPSANRGFGLHTISTHEHNGHTPAESDGYANAFFFPGQFYDYRWPLQLAGYDTINTSATDPKAAYPCEPGETLRVNNDTTASVKACVNGSIPIRGDWRETMSTHWFHDHMLDFTAQNVYKGNAAMMNYYSAIDRGNEAVNDGVNLRFPSGTALPWGNRDYDVNLVVADKAWDKDGQLWFNIFNTDGFVGDQVLVNWTYKPYMDVRARRYRFRILDGSVSRFFAIGLVQQVNGTGGSIPGPAGSNISYNRVPFHMIGNDGNIMEHSVAFDSTRDAAHNAVLPTQGIAERYDIIVDFAKNGIQPGDKLYFVNTLEHTNGKVTGKSISLEDILSGKYHADLTLDANGVPNHWINGDPCIGKFMELRVQAYAGTDLSMDPANYTSGKSVMIPLTINRDDLTDKAKLAAARHRTFTFGRSNGTDTAPWTVKTDGGTGYNMDPRRLSAAPTLANGPSQGGFSGDGTLEIWRIELGGGGWSHPVHVHFEEGILLSRGDKPVPEWEKWARKDVYRIGPDADSLASVEMAIHFREFAGTYMEHCHNTQHEDNSMLLRWDIEKPGQFKLLPTPLPTWEGVQYVDTAALPTFRTGEGFGLAKTGNAPVTGSILINGGAAATASSTAALTLSASSANGAITQMQFSKDGGVTWTPYENYATTRNVSLAPPGDGSKTITVRYRDALGVPSAPFTALITVSAAPPTGSILINGGAATTSSTSATLTLAATSIASTVTNMQFSKDGGATWFPFETYAITRNVTLAPAGPGVKTVSVRYQDAGGRISATYTASITLNAAVPTGTILINGGATTTSSTAATLTLSASSAAGAVTKMQFSKDGGTTWTPLEAYATTRNVTLAPAGPGVKTMAVRYVDVAGNVSAPASASITYSDTTGPTGSILINGGAATTTSAAATLTLSATDASGVAKMQFSKDGGVTWFPLEPYATTRNVTLTPPGPGTKTVAVRFTDTAGNLSAAYQASILMQ